jgi:DNA-binding MarR family transcriptional regulator
MIDTLPPDHLDRIVEQWERERPDLAFEALGVLGRLFRVSELADTALAAGLADERDERGWFDVLAALRRSGAPYELNPTELSRAMLLSSGGTTKRLDRLEAAGLVERRPDPGDRRGTLVRLTRKGKTLIDRAVARHIVNEEALLRVLTPAEQRSLDRLLRKLLAGLELSEDPTPAASPSSR